MNSWEAIIKMVESEGIKFIFGLGDNSLQLFTRKPAQVTSINVRYEGSAPFMAMAYSRLSGKPGVCSASPGPGVANLIPAVLEAYYACSPLVMICPSASQKTEGMGEFQECDMLGLMKPVTKWSVRIPYTERIPWFVRRAFDVAMNGQPGPVFLELPKDVEGGLVDGYVDVGQPEYVPSRKIRTAGDPKLINEAAGLVLGAKRLVVVAGNGAVQSEASRELREFVELLGVPFMTTPGGRGILSEDHPLALGQVGIYRTKVGKKVYSTSDLMVTIGTRNESFQTHGWADFPEGAKLIQVDISPFEIGRNWIPNVGIVGDVKLVLQQLVEAIKEKAGSGGNFQEMPQVKRLMEDKREFETEVQAECNIEATPIPAKRIVYELSKVFGTSTILVSENGSQDTWSYCWPYYEVRDGSECVPVAEQTCMGMGVVGAIAAKLTKPEKKVVCVCGDGAFQMFMKELPTAAQNSVGCTWVVLNNSALGWVKHLQMEHAGWDAGLSFKVQPDFVRYAEDCKCFGRRIEDPSDIIPSLEEALKVNREGIPAVLDFVTGIDMSHFERAK